MHYIKRLLLENMAWARGHAAIDPDYFTNMAKDQSPEILWIGCADSRVPPDEIINTKPGSLFVHRNIANLVYQDDENLMSVFEYAVLYLKVKYIIVCGHYNCGGVKAAFEGINNDRLSHWTRVIGEVKKQHAPKSVNELVDLSVQAQLETIKNLPMVQKVWNEGAAYPKLIGWVYDLNSGLIKEIASYAHQG